VKLLSILALLVALSAHALSVKDWEKKSAADRSDYLAICIVNLSAEIAKTDRPLAVKIREWYSVKPFGKTYTDGSYAVFTRLVQLEKQEKDGQADLSKIEVEDIVYSITAAQFKLPDRESAAAPARVAPPAPAPAPSPTAKAPPATPPQNADNDWVGPGGFIRPPGLQTDDSEKATPPPALPLPKPFMVGRLDVSHFAGLKPGDSEARVISLYGRADLFNGINNGIPKTYDRGQLTVTYANGVVKRVQLYSKDPRGARPRVGNDAVLDLFGHTEADVIALLGPPKRRESFETAAYVLSWDFSMPDRPAEYADQASAQTGQTLVLGMRTSGGCCYSMIVTW
jgi:hypothetical protein